MNKRKIQLKVLQFKEKELELKIKQLPKRPIRIIDFPCELGGRVVLEIDEGYKNKDLKKAFLFLKETIKTQCSIYRELSEDEKQALF